MIIDKTLDWHGRPTRVHITMCDEEAAHLASAIHVLLTYLNAHDITVSEVLKAQQFEALDTLLVGLKRSI